MKADRSFRDVSPSTGEGGRDETPRCGNASGRVLITLDDWAYGDPYQATRTGAYLQSRGIRAAFFLINEYARKYPGIVSTLRK